ncbi:hypothetical protein IV203_028779 [Nitzschia inconspicua]|uniref:Uncharacterized protein n=1 Tax=Nitzschia inconspicua TaxID=303405 RepID=A0A9K3LP98_9STRA|nr:hypothetical protein IV203_028779 [Nitzschia inconspicua]
MSSSSARTNMKSRANAKEDLATANKRAIEKNLKQGKDRLGNTGSGFDPGGNDHFSGAATTGFFVGTGFGGCSGGGCGGGC